MFNLKENKDWTHFLQFYRILYVLSYSFKIVWLGLGYEVVLLDQYDQLLIQIPSLYKEGSEILLALTRYGRGWSDLYFSNHHSVGILLILNRLGFPLVTSLYKEPLSEDSNLSLLHSIAHSSPSISLSLRSAWLPRMKYVFSISWLFGYQWNTNEASERTSFNLYRRGFGLLCCFYTSMWAVPYPTPIKLAITLGNVYFSFHSQLQTMVYWNVCQVWELQSPEEI